MRIQQISELGLLVRKRRVQLGVDLEELASSSGTYSRWLSDLENGKARADLRHLLEVLRALDLSLELDDVTPGQTTGALFDSLKSRP